MVRSKVKIGLINVISVISIFVVSVIIFFILSFVLFKGYGGYPNGFSVEGNILYVLDNGFSHKPEGPILPFLWPTTDNAIWTIDLEKNKLKELRKVSRFEDEQWQELIKTSIKGLQGFHKSELAVGNQTYAIKNDTSKEYSGVIQIKTANGEVENIKYPGKNFSNIIIDRSENVYFTGFSLISNGNPLSYLYIFDKQSNKVEREISLPLRGIDYIYFQDATIYIFGIQSQKENNIYPFTVIKFDRVNEKQEIILKAKNNYSGSAISNGLLFYGEKATINGLQRPKVTIYNFIEEKKVAEITGTGLGTNPITANIGIGLTWLTIPLGLIYAVFVYPLRIIFG